MRIFPRLLALLFSASLFGSVAAVACSPPPPVPDDVAKRSADVIVVGYGIFAEATHGGVLHPGLIRKGVKQRAYPIRIHYRWSGMPGALCPPINALVGSNFGVFYLTRQGDHYSIIKFVRGER